MRDDKPLPNWGGIITDPSAIVRDARSKSWGNQYSTEGPASTQVKECQEALAATLLQELSTYFDEKIIEQHWLCRWKGRLHVLLAKIPSCNCRTTSSLAETFDQLYATGRYNEITRLGTIYSRRLLPLVRRNFSWEIQTQLIKTLKTFILLRFLEIPYYGYNLEVDPDSCAVHLMELYLQCQGQGLMLWREGKRTVFVIETDRERFVTWIIKRMTYFQHKGTRNKVLNDALWSTFFAQSDTELRDKQKIVFDTGQVFSLSRACPLARDAVKLHTENSPVEHIVVFESPWQQDRGWRAQRALRSLPAHIPKTSISIWEPCPLDPEERLVLRQYLATQMALRYALEGYQPNFCKNWLIRALRRSYLKMVPTALQMLIDSYREGQVIVDTSVLKPHAQDRDLLYTLGLIWKKVAW